MTTSLNPFPEGARSPDPFYTTGGQTRFWHSQFGVIHVTNLRIDTNKRQVYKGDERWLTGMEFSLLELLVSRSGEAFSARRFCRKCGYTPERHVDTAWWMFTFAAQSEVGR